MTGHESAGSEQAPQQGVVYAGCMVAHGDDRTPIARRRVIQKLKVLGIVDPYIGKPCIVHYEATFRSMQ